MAQPKWRLIDSADYYAIYEDTTGVYPEEAVVAQEISEKPYDHDGTFEVFRFPLDRLEAGGHEEWFERDLGSVANSVGATKAELLADLRSADPMRRFRAYEAIGGYHGYHNLDDYPRKLHGDQLDNWLR
jgi:hypothetical protein